MGISQFSDEIRRFLAGKEPEVLCITGKWGVGKTYAWKLFLDKAQKEKNIALSRYAYVSLFGQNSLADIRYALFENTIPSDQIGKKPDLSTLQSSIEGLLGHWRGWLKFLQYVPRVGESAMNVARLGFINVRKQLVCIDDLERAGKGLEQRDVLGLVSFLKEERECKVVLLLNDEALAKEGADDFRVQLEKVADTVLHFEPTPTEAADIGLERSTSFHDQLHADCIALGVVNIRLIKRMERFARRLETELGTYDPRILHQAIHSASLFILAKYQPPDTAPTLDFIKRFNPYEGMIGKDKGPDPHANWRAFLRQFGWTHTDEFDAVILGGVEQGSLDAGTLKAAAQTKEKEFKLRDKDQSFSEAWDLYHDCFDDNVEAVLDGFEAAIRKSAPAITPMNLSSTIGVLKELGRKEKVNELIQAYVDARSNEQPEFWDLSRSAFARDVKDVDVIEAFRKRREVAEEKPDAGAVLERIGTQKAWNPEDIAFLSTLDVDDFYRIFKAKRGRELRLTIYGAQMFRELSATDENLKKITGNGEEALRRIGTESRLNARRVRAYGINLDAAEAEQHD